MNLGQVSNGCKNAPVIYETVVAAMDLNTTARMLGLVSTRIVEWRCEHLTID